MAWPTSTNPKEQTVSVRMTPTLVARVNTVVLALGMSRSDFIRDAIETATKKHERTAARRDVNPSTLNSEKESTDE